MNEDATRRVTARFDEDVRFERADEGRFESTTTPFDATVRLAGADDDRTEVRVTVYAPMLDAVVAGETVAPVVEDGWFETLELRLADAYTVVGDDDTAPPIVERDGEHAVVSLAFRAGDPERATEDAQSVIDFVEGTWMQGVIPGYEYEEPARGMIEEATQNYDA